MLLGERSTILIVDDEPDNRLLVRRILEAEHEVVEADSAAAAERVLAATPVDLVLLDVMMPEVDGFAACRAIKARTRDGFLPVLLLTALKDPGHRHQGFESGCDDFVAKPFDARELILRVRAFLRLRAQDEAIRGQLAELRTLDRLKDELAGLLVHDLRSPLAGLDGYLQVLREEATQPDELLELAVDASRALRDTIEDMVRVRTLETDAVELVREPLAVRQLVDDAAATLQPAAAARDVTVAVDGPAFEARLDRTLVRRAVENLLAAAIRNTRPGTRVGVTVRDDGGVAEIEVTDQATPPPVGERAAIFAKYVPSADGRGRPRRGVGLGLYLVRLAAELHGGTVAVAAGPDGGTSVVLRLPTT